LQFTQADTQAKNAKEYVFANAAKIIFKKFPTLQKTKIHQRTAQQTQARMTRKLHIEKQKRNMVDIKSAGTASFA
jgi:hypothetical protein